MTKKFKQLENQLDESQKCQLNVKTEASSTHSPLICIGDDSDNDDVIFIPPEDYSPKKRQRLENEKLLNMKRSTSKGKGSISDTNEEISMTVISTSINLPHARADCKHYKFVQGNVTTASVSCNEKSCEQCYCYVCDNHVRKVSCNCLTLEHLSKLIKFIALLIKVLI